MKIVTRKESNMSLFVLNDDEVLSWSDQGMVIGEPAWLIVPDCPQESVTVYTGVDAPADWIGSKFLFDGSAWSIDPNWEPPKINPDLVPLN